MPRCAKLGSEPVPLAELATRQAVLVGGFGRTVETTDGIADILASYTLQGVPLGELSRISRAFRRSIRRRCGDLGQPARSQGGEHRGGRRRQAVPARATPGASDVEVIPAAAVDLDTPKLR
jgi:hypothetical protein